MSQCAAGSEISGSAGRGRRRRSKADRAYLFANNGALPVLQVMDRGFGGWGLSAVAMTRGSKDPAEHFVSFDDESVLLGFTPFADSTACPDW